MLDQPWQEAFGKVDVYISGLPTMRPAMAPNAPSQGIYLTEPPEFSEASVQQATSFAITDLAPRLQRSCSATSRRRPNLAVLRRATNSAAKVAGVPRSRTGQHVTLGLLRNQSESALRGVSCRARSENARAQSSLRSLTPAGKLRIEDAASCDTFPCETIGKDIDKLGVAIAEVKEAFELFDPRSAGASLPFSVILEGGHAVVRGPTLEEIERKEDAIRDAQERQAERLRRYKYCRKLEPDLPPLLPLSADSLPPRKLPAQTILARNTSAEAIAVWLPEKRLQRIQDFCEEAEFWSEDLDRKWQQAKGCVEQRKLRVAQRKRANDFPVAKWLTIMCMTNFLEHIWEEVKMRRMGVVERLAYVKACSQNVLVKKSKTAAGQLQHASIVESVSASPCVARSVAVMVASARLKKLVVEARRSAKLVFTALNNWKIGGTAMVLIRTVRPKAITLQTWWRRCFARLRRQVDRVSQRWEQLEWQRLASELASEEQRPASRPAGSAREWRIKPVDRTDEKIMARTVSKEVRLKFLRNELRSRRFLLLPQVAFWETECQRWYEQCRKSGDSPQSYLNHPSCRPSHLPPDHPSAEATIGASCRRNCPGRRGDAEILDMWRRCRQEPCSWKKLVRKHSPTKRTKQRVDLSCMDMDALMSQLEADVDQDFGDAPEQDMMAYGVDDSTLPGGEPLDGSEQIGDSC
eukprot:TRINITY_DN13745_c0_g1_i2.p1 TRINITY_DN13745_c0_g1~~TRINITY_DN13745_c0_g1_i2.p1  ORF type:complete len:693 (+),score=118.31 TRINITY_DN13745_c0_g1_i2:61-2139(+)